LATGNLIIKSTALIGNGFPIQDIAKYYADFADDERITSNDKIDNPNTTVLEFINQQPSYKGKVAAFASWDVFPYIIMRREVVSR